MADDEVDEDKVDEILKKIMSYTCWNERVGGLVRDLGNGREIHCVQQIYNFRISIGPSGSDEWDDSW